MGDQVRNPMVRMMSVSEAARDWNVLAQTIREIQNKNHSCVSFETLYRSSYQIVLHKHGALVYEGVKELITGQLQSVVRAKVVNAMAANFLESLNFEWDDFVTTMTMIRDILMYLDRTYVQMGILQVFELSVTLFREFVIYNDNVDNHIRSVLLAMIRAERSGENISCLEVRKACRMLLDIGVVETGLRSRSPYEDIFERHFLEETKEFYHNESLKFLGENTASEYLLKVERCLEDEAQRADACFVFGEDAKTKERILAILHEELIMEHLDTVINMENTGMTSMLLNARNDDLKRLYRLVSRVSEPQRNSGLAKMATCMSKHLRELGKNVIEANTGQPSSNSEETTTPYNPITFVQCLLDLKEKFDQILFEAFEKDLKFQQQVYKDFEYIMNLSPKSPENLSLYIGDLLKKTNKQMSGSDNDFDLLADKALMLFRFLGEKDVFERYYKSHLARRLLQQKKDLESQDAEKVMLVKLRTECGCNFTAKLEGMLKDMDISKDLMSGFRELPAIPISTELSVSVLTLVHWPTVNAIKCPLPPDAAASFDRFMAYYSSKHQSRNLMLQPSLGSAELRAFFGNQDPKILNVNTFQMIILMKFNEKDMYTFDELHVETNIPHSPLKLCLASMAMGKIGQRVLCRRGSGKEIGNNDEFYVNDSFTSKLRLIRIQMASSKGETDVQVKETRKKVDDDRKLEVDASIVRIMKARKKILHNNLVTEVTDQLKERFLPDPTLIKKRVESLLEREYLERDADEQRMYCYKA